MTLTPTGQALHIVPRIAVLGIGCRRGTAAEHLEAAFAAFCRESGLAPQGVAAAASIDLKRDEPGLRAFCAAHGFAFETFSAAQLVFSFLIIQKTVFCFRFNLIQDIFY